MKKIKNLRDFDNLFEMPSIENAYKSSCIVVDHWESGGPGSPESEGEGAGGQESGPSGGDRDSDNLTLDDLDWQDDMTQDDWDYLDQDLSAMPPPPTVEEQAQQILTQEQKLAKFLLDAAQFISSLVIGKTIPEDIRDGLESLAKKWGVSDEERIEQIINDLENAESNEDANQILQDASSSGSGAGEGTSGGDAPGGDASSGVGTTTETPTTTTPSSPDQYKFWDDFVTEWENAKGYHQAQDAWRKEQMQPQMQTYQNRLLGQTGEGLFQPITWGMGDFRSTFMPSYSQDLAKNVLGSQLAETELMTPYRGEMDYLSQLWDVASKEASLANALSIANVQNPKYESNWLDTLGDLVNIGTGIGDIYTDIWGD